MWKFVQFLSTDKLLLQGILSRPDSPEGVLVYVHGLTDSFTGDFEIITVLQEELAKNNWGILAFNNRGAGLVTRFKRIDKKEKKGYRSENIGSVYEEFEDCIYDIEGAVNFVSLKTNFGKIVRHENNKKAKDLSTMCKIVLCGISTGSNKVAYYASKKLHSASSGQENKNVKGLILLSAVSNIEALKLELKDRFQDMAERASVVTKKGKGWQLMASNTETFKENFPFSAKRFLSLVKNNGNEDIFPYIGRGSVYKTLSKIKIPMIFIYGDKDEHMQIKPKDVFKILSGVLGKTSPFCDIDVATTDKTKTDKQQIVRHKKKFQGVIIKETGHGFSGKENELSEAVSNFIVNL